MVAFKRSRRNSSEYLLDQLLTPYIANRHMRGGDLPPIGLQFFAKRARYMCIDDNTLFRFIQKTKGYIVVDIIQRQRATPVPNVQLIHNKIQKNEFTSTEILVAYKLINM